MFQISPLKETILKVLAEYKYLTVSQLVAIGVSPSVESCRREMRFLKERGLTWRMVNTSVPESLNKRLKLQRIRNEDINFLTVKGARFLRDEARMDMKNIRYPQRQKHTLSNDYFHRVSSVSVHIAYNQWTEKNGFTSTDTLLYYDKRAKFSHIKTTIETRIKLKGGSTKTPDLVFGYENEKGDGRVFIVEIYNGARPQYIQEQTKDMLEAIQENTELSDRVGLKKLPRILITCETENRVLKAIERIKQNQYFNFDRIGQLIFFNTDRKVWGDFGNDWVNIFGEVVNLHEL